MLKFPQYKWLWLSFFLLLTACSGTTAEKWFAPDPKLEESPFSLNASPTPTSSPSPTTKPLPKGTASPSKPKPTPTPEEIQGDRLPQNFPKSLPRYPEATLVTSSYQVGTIQGKTQWETDDQQQAIEDFYRNIFEQKPWEISPSKDEKQDTKQDPKQDPKQDEKEDTKTLVAHYQQDKEKLTVILSFPKPQTPKPETSEKTVFLLTYGDEAALSKSGKNSPQDTITKGNISQLPPIVKTYIQDVAALGIFSPEDFQPDKPLSRRTFAQWLFQAHNQMYRDRPTQQIRPVTNAPQPAFQDIKSDDPDFAIIQGLAEAGIIPSRLTNNTRALLFQPNAPLTRETLILWKVPLDKRQALPTTPLSTLQKTWGFQDLESINPAVYPALLADFENGENGNIVRAFGYTTLFQPKKPVTQAEAAAALWYFGVTGEGISAQEAKALQ